VNSAPKKEFFYAEGLAPVFSFEKKIKWPLWLFFFKELMHVKNRGIINGCARFFSSFLEKRGFMDKKNGLKKF
jgi:hypothetical protein